MDILSAYNPYYEIHSLPFFDIDIHTLLFSKAE